MPTGELSFQSLPCVIVTWTIPDFFRLTAESDSSLRSPDFTFADGRHCLRLLRDQYWNRHIVIELLNPERAVLDNVVLKSTTEEIDFYRFTPDEKVFSLDLWDLGVERDECVPADTFTVLCYVRSRQPGTGTSGGAETRVLPQCRMTGHLSSESFPGLYVTWTIPAFFPLPRKSRFDLESPKFPFSDCRYHLQLFWNKRFVNIELLSNPVKSKFTRPVPRRYASHEVGLKSTTGEEIPIGLSNIESTGRVFCISRDDDAMQRVHFPDGHLTAFCCMYRSDKEALPGISNIVSDLRQLLHKMPNSDACLLVSGKEFRAHQNILRARSKVFDTMFGHETEESLSGRVVIDDLDPDSFGDFLEYLYTGVVGAGISEDNAFGLYKAADKYDVPSLKSECLAHMRRSVSVDSFCDVLAMALLHSEKELLSRLVLFFKENMPRIIVTAKWQQFAIDNGKSANDLIKECGPPFL